MRRLEFLALVIALGACTPDDDTGGMFGTSATSPATSVTATATATATATDGDTDADTEAEDDDDDDASTGSTTSDGETTSGMTTTATSTTATSTTAAETGTSTGMGESTDSNGSGMGQPAMGMYSHCTVAMNTCGPSPETCLEITDADNGFCSITGCVNPAVDCDPTPMGSTAPPLCMQSDDGSGNAIELCALDCSAGQVCPTGMVCVQNVSFGDGFPSYSICV